MSGPLDRSRTTSATALAASAATAAAAARVTAVALSYTEADAAPRVVAKGSGVLAEEIIRRAREAGVFVHESAELVGLLAKLDLDAHIPPALYFAIAEILAWIYAVERNGGNDAGGSKTRNHAPLPSGHLRTSTSHQTSQSPSQPPSRPTPTTDH